MPALPVYNLKKEKVGTIELDDSVFSAKLNPHLLHDAVRYQIAKRYEFRTANSKTRSEVAGSGKKMYKQKGTGNARHGDAKAPIFVGGGKAHGPKPRRVRRSLNKKTLRAALLSALSQAQKQDRLFVLDKLELEKHSTKQVHACQKAFGLTKVLFVNEVSSDKQNYFNRSTRNLPAVKHLEPKGMNVFDILKYENLLISQTAVQKLTERLKRAD